MLLKKSMLLGAVMLMNVLCRGGDVEVLLMVMLVVVLMVEVIGVIWFILMIVMLVVL